MRGGLDAAVLTFVGPETTDPALNPADGGMEVLARVCVRVPDAANQQCGGVNVESQFDGAPETIQVTGASPVLQTENASVGAAGSLRALAT
jgi:hypothetical protein